jgi:hypothetical protein
VQFDGAARSHFVGNKAKRRDGITINAAIGFARAWIVFAVA